MKIFKTLRRAISLLFIGTMLALCMVMGVAPIPSKRKEQYVAEVKEDSDDDITSDTIYFADSFSENKDT